MKGRKERDVCILNKRLNSIDSTDSVLSAESWRSTPRPRPVMSLESRVLRSESKQIWILFASISFRYICKNHLFASFVSYLLQIMRRNLPTNIWFFAKQIHIEANIHFRVNIHFRANICFTFSHTGEYSLQNICFVANIHKTSTEFHIQANIFWQVFAYKRVFTCKYLHTKLQTT